MYTTVTWLTNEGAESPFCLLGLTTVKVGNPKPLGKSLVHALDQVFDSNKKYCMVSHIFFIYCTTMLLCYTNLIFASFQSDFVNCLNVNVYFALKIMIYSTKPKQYNIFLYSITLYLSQSITNKINRTQRPTGMLCSASRVSVSIYSISSIVLK